MLKSRRGLLAAGLAVAVVGALGVASTMNAGAEQVSGDQSAAQAPAADQADATTAADVSVPPATLPWGDKPQRAHRGRPGASSSELRAQGLQAAPDTHSHRINFAPKGHINRSTFLKSEDTDVIPPTPVPSTSSSSPASPATTSPATTATTVPATTSPATTAPAAQSATTSAVQPLAATDPPSPATTSTPPVITGGTDNSSKALMFYSTASEATIADGIYAAMDIEQPTLADGDFHTLAELAVQSADTHQTVEVGWTVDRSVNGDDYPHMFVFNWVNNVPGCYNTCGNFVPYKGGVAPGDTLPAGTLRKFGIKHSNGAWWVAYDTTWVGYFPDADWSSQGVDFTQGGYFQAWGEVAAASLKTCTQMGSGSDPTIKTQVDASARIGSITYVNNPATPNMWMRSSSNLYGMGPVTARTFRFGGDPCPPSPSPSPSS